MNGIFYSMVEYSSKLIDLLRDQATWSQKTFGSDSERGPKGALLHLEKEAREAVEAIGTDALVEELADCQLLIWDAARRAGIKPMRLLDAAIEKQRKNMARQWPVPSPDMPVEHIREGEE